VHRTRSISSTAASCHTRVDRPPPLLAPRLIHLRQLAGTLFSTVTILRPLFPRLRGHQATKRHSIGYRRRSVAYFAPLCSVRMGLRKRKCKPSLTWARPLLGRQLTAKALHTLITIAPSCTVLSDGRLVPQTNHSYYYSRTSDGVKGSRWAHTPPGLDCWAQGQVDQGQVSQPLHRLHRYRAYTH